MAEHLDAGRYEAIRSVIGPDVQFAQGDEAFAYGALLAGCTYFAGYPITPATEMAEAMARLLPRVGGTYIQMEDEIASISAVVGAAWTGARAMTATSGPGFSLMQETIGYACMTETPCVVLDVQRSGPSTGQPTRAAQGDMMQARWGTHGDHEVVALAPSTVQECLELTIDAFNLAERLRNPVILLSDGDVAHMRERLIVPGREGYSLERRAPPAGGGAAYVPFDAGEGGVPRVADFGHGHHTYVTGLTHDVTGLPSTDDAARHAALVTRLVGKVTSRREELSRVEVDAQGRARVGILSYGITARPARGAIRLLRDRGVAVSGMRLVTIWPFPNRQVAEFAQGLDRIIVPEMNLGQVVHPVREAVGGLCQVVQLPKIGGEMHNPVEIADAVERSLGGGRAGGGG